MDKGPMANYVRHPTTGSVLVVLATEEVMNKHYGESSGWKPLNGSPVALRSSIADVIRGIESDPRASERVERQTPASDVFVGNDRNEALIAIPESELGYFESLVDNYR